MGFIVPALILAVWQLFAGLELINVVWFPAPLTILMTLYEIGVTGELWEHITVTALRVYTGFLIGALIGTIMGSITGYSKTSHRLFDPLLQALRNIPGLAWSPLYLMWFGIFEESKIALIATAAFFPVYLTLSAGITQVPRRYIEIGMIFELSPVGLITRIIFPAATPAWITGLRNGMGSGWTVAVAAELMGASTGLGFLMYDAQQVSRADIIMASIILFAIMGKISDSVLVFIGNKLLHYQKIE